MLKAIAAALAGLWRGTLGAIRWGEQLLRWPFSVVFGSGGGAMPNPDYKPAVSSAELLDEFDAARARQAAVHDLDRDGISTVLRYAKALPEARPTMDLSGLGEDVRTTLLTMDEHELKALAQAGIGAVRKFVAGQGHGVLGVPVVGSVKHIASPQELSAKDKWKVRAFMLKANGGSEEFKLAR
ncbi:hypothetical protein CN087_12740 [Sinorhizobium meliloti]|nr:hypothetical protein CN087_12740 [Sinorhizobium meliloti]